MRIEQGRRTLTAESPLAEGRELKYNGKRPLNIVMGSPLAEGRELKSLFFAFPRSHYRRPSRRGVN